jgi:UDPglucose 6-dehydrogenase
MKVTVLGTWHLGSVTAACLAALGHEVTGVDADREVIAGLAQGRAPLFEPGLDELLQAGLQQGQLHFLDECEQAFAGADILWVTYDTPVDEEDRADTRVVLDAVKRVLPWLAPRTLVLVSSQLPVGSVAGLEAHAACHLARHALEFACAPENLRLGQAVEVFMRPDRVVVGVRSTQARERVQRLLDPLAPRIEWMSVESAEMTKHAINAFLATSVSWANEVASLCEVVGADGREVARGLKSEARIGPRAYVSPGAAFAGGTLARDVAYLGDIAQRYGLRAPLLQAVGPSNETHKSWARRKLERQLGGLAGARIALWGLAYKAGTSTLRRSWMVELCDGLLEQGAQVYAFDPHVAQWPARWAAVVRRCQSPVQAAEAAQALVVGTSWPEFRSAAQALAEGKDPPAVVLDPAGALAGQTWPAGVSYLSVGTPDAVRA